MEELHSFQEEADWHHGDQVEVVVLVREVVQVIGLVMGVVQVGLLLASVVLVIHQEDH